MNRDVFLSILALDAYNRGLGAGIAGLPAVSGSTKIGTATIQIQSSSAAAAAAGFHAVSYSWNGQTVISYRGTDTSSLGALGADVWNGWTAGAGFATASQVGLAIQSVFRWDAWPATARRRPAPPARPTR